MPRAAIKETDVARAIIAHFEGFDIYQEVAWMGCVADIVVDVNGWGHVIETKTSLGLPVLAQAAKWVRKGVKRVSIGVPRSKGSDSRHLAEDIARNAGIGIYELHRFGSGVGETIRPRFRRGKSNPRPDILDVCVEEHKTFCAAGSRSGRWSPYKQTCKLVLKVVEESPGLSIREIVDRVEHHYASDTNARACLLPWIREGKVPGVEAKRCGRYWEMYAKES